MSEPREDFLKKVQLMLIGKVDEQTEAMVTAIVRIAAEDFEITERCTELATTETMNEDLLKNYSATMIIEGKRPKTVAHYIYQLQKFAEAVGKDFRNVTTGDIKLYMARRTAAGIAARTVDNERACLSAFYQWLIDEEYIEKNPTRKIKKVKYQRKEENPFSQQELAMIRDTTKDQRDRAMVEFLLASGVRVEELAEMQKTDIKDDLTVIVREGKGGKYRTTAITPTCAMYLRKYINSRKDTDNHLFVSKRAASALDTDSIRKILHDLEKESGVQNIHPHRFRHTFATDLANRGVPITTIQELLGHTNLNTTKIYINQSHERTMQDYKRAAV